jgi:hypothetical protein
MKNILCLALLISVALSSDCFADAAAALTAQEDKTATTTAAVITTCVPASSKLAANVKYSTGTDAMAGNVYVVATTTNSAATEATLVCAHTDAQTATTIPVGAYVSATSPIYYATNVKSCTVTYKAGLTAVNITASLVTKAFATACTAGTGAATKADNTESATAYDLTFANAVIGCKVGPYNLTTLNAKGISFQLVTLPTGANLSCTYQKVGTATPSALVTATWYPVAFTAAATGSYEMAGNIYCMAGGPVANVVAKITFPTVAIVASSNASTVVVGFLTFIGFFLY